MAAAATAGGSTLPDSCATPHLQQIRKPGVAVGHVAVQALALHKSVDDLAQCQQAAVDGRALSQPRALCLCHLLPLASCQVHAVQLQRSDELAIGWCLN